MTTSGLTPISCAACFSKRRAGRGEKSKRVEKPPGIGEGGAKRSPSRCARTVTWRSRTRAPSSAPAPGSSGPRNGRGPRRRLSARRLPRETFSSLVAAVFGLLAETLSGLLLSRSRRLAARSRARRERTRAADMRGARVRPPIHSALRRRTPSDFGAGWTFRAYSLASIPFGKRTREQAMPFGDQLLRERLGGTVAGVVAVVGDQDVLGAVALEGRQVVEGEAFDAVAARDVPEAGAPEGESVDQRLAEDDFLRRLERLDVEDAAVWCRGGRGEAACPAGGRRGSSGRRSPGPRRLSPRIGTTSEPARCSCPSRGRCRASGAGSGSRSRSGGS